MGELQGGINWDIPQFIPDGPSVASEGEDVAEDTLKCPTVWEPLSRSYEGHTWFYIVFAPYNKAYENDQEWFYNYAVDKARKWACNKGNAFYVTREIDATKCHSNLLICSSSDLLKYHGKSAYNKYRINVSELHTLGDRQRVLSYINKESIQRPFKLYSDYYYTK